jgi:hypothetical protein
VQYEGNRDRGEPVIPGGLEEDRHPVELRTDTQRTFTRLAQNRAANVAFLTFSPIAARQALLDNPNTPPLVEALVGYPMTEFIPRKRWKVSGTDAFLDIDETPKVEAMKHWPAAVFRAITGGSTPMGRDSGVCVHPDPRAPKNNIITLMASRDHTDYAYGIVWTILLGGAGAESFRPTKLPWVYESLKSVSVMTAHRYEVDKHDLFGPPALAQPDDELRGLGFPTYPGQEHLPLRGRHKDFDPRYVCGTTGGHLYMTQEGELFTIGDFGRDWTPGQSLDDPGPDDEFTLPPPPGFGENLI